MKTNKYHNKKVTHFGIEFQSQAEGKRFLILKALQDSGLITGLQLQVAFELAPAVTIQGRKHPPLKYIADFTYFREEEMIIEDVKGMSKVPQLYALKLHLMMSVLGLEINEVRL